MKSLIIFYSITGNNKMLAEALEKKLPADLLEIKTKNKKTIVSIIGDVIFNRTPIVEGKLESFENYKQIIFIGPVWLGKFATVFRSYLKSMNLNDIPFNIISLNGGIDGDNIGLKSEIEKLTKRNDGIIFDLHLKDLLPKETLVTREAVSKYKLNDLDVSKLIGYVLSGMNYKQ